VTGWTPGAPVIERLLEERRLERVLGAQAGGSSWLDRARQTIAAADAIEQASPDSAFVLGYERRGAPTAGPSGSRTAHGYEGRLALGVGPIRRGSGNPRLVYPGARPASVVASTAVAAS